MSASLGIDYIGHACLKINCGKLKLLTDPWISGPAYTRQWYLYPSPDESARLDDIQYIHYSHGHEDHLHPATFPLLPKQATVLLTKQWFPSNKKWLKSEGFRNIREVPSGRWLRLADPTGKDAVRCVNLVNRSDSMSILLTDTEVLVNVNDALHCYDNRCIDHYCERIRSLTAGRVIRYLFCGFGGASYFPNCIRHAKKNDYHVAMERERHLALGFARVVRNLKPQMAFAFAAGLVLLEPFNRWINEIKFMSDPVRVVEEECEDMQGRVFKLMPGDRIAQGQLWRKAQERTATEHSAEYQRLYKQEIEMKDRTPPISAPDANQVLERLKEQFRSRLEHGAAKHLSFDWAVQLRDCPGAIRRFTLRDQLCDIEPLAAESLCEVRDMVVEVNSDVLLTGMNSLWGGDSMQIGYGAIFHLRSDASVRDNHTRQFLRLATQLPMQSDYLRISPSRGIAHLYHSPFLMREAIGIVTSKTQRRNLDSSAGRSDLMEGKRWIEAPKCSGCPVCDLPAAPSNS